MNEPSFADERAVCTRRGCPGHIEATVPLWLNLHADGTWSVYGVGDEAADITCDEHEHDHNTVALRKSLSAFLDELLPATTWDGSVPLPDEEADP